MIRLFEVLGMVAAGACAALALGTAYGDDGTQPTRLHCVDLRRIDHTEVVGDRAILFFMKNDEVYQNRLPNACPGLEGDRPFMYRVMGGRLCDTDVVTVLERWGFGFTPTASCLLGPFDAIDAAGIDALRAIEKRAARHRD